MSEQTPDTVQAARPDEPEPEPETATATETETAVQPQQPAPEAVGAAGQPEESASAGPLAPPAQWASAQPGPDAAPQQPPKPRRPFPWRWVGATVLALAVGSGCAFGVMAAKRTDVPGLATAADGRYDFAPLVMPTLAPGQSDPNNPADKGGQHISDIRRLLLPAPVGATPDASLPGDTGWVTESATIAVAGGDASTDDLATDGWRHTAGVAWRTPDGAETKIYLVQFIDSEGEGAGEELFASFGGVGGGTGQTFDVNANSSVIYKKSVSGATTTWYGQAQAQDTEFLIVYKAPTSVGIAPFKQEADLQVELLE